MWNAALCACALPLGGRLAGLPSPGRSRLCAASVLGGLCALLPLWLPAAGALGLIGLPCAVALCFSRHGAGACVRCSFTTLCASLLTGGAMSALCGAGLSAPCAGACALGVSLAVCLLGSLLPSALCEVRQVELCVKEQAILLPAMLDTGNLLRDPVTGLSVLVIPLGAARTLFPGLHDPAQLSALPLGFRLLNVRTAAGSALLPMFRPDRCRIYLNGRVCEAELLAAVAGCEYRGQQALVPASALPPGALSS